MQKKNAQYKGIVELQCEVSIEASEVSGVQGLDSKVKFSAFYLVRGCKGMC